MAVLTYEAESVDLSDRFRDISTKMSDLFRSSCKAEPIGDIHKSARISSVYADGVAMCRAEMTPLRLVKNGGTSGGAQKYLVAFVNKRSIINVDEGSPTVLQPCDMIIFRDDQTINWAVSEHYETLSLMIDGAVFREFIPQDTLHIGRRIPMAFGVHDLLLGIFDTAWEFSCAGLFEEAGPRIVRSFLGILSTALLIRAPEYGKNNVSKALDLRRLQIKSYINKNFSVPDLSARSISRDLGFSSRYVQLALAADKLTPTDYIRNVRLNNAAHMLSDTSAHQRSVTEIAYTCGFNSSSHFSTVFKSHFGCSPREFREVSRQ